MEKSLSDEGVSVSLDDWLTRTNAEYEPIRIAMYMVIYAFASDDFLSKNIVLKGGSLLSLGYGSQRHTTDIDFSIIDSEGFNPDEFEKILERALFKANVVFSPKGISCAFQSVKYRPKISSGNFPKYRFPSIEMKIGYAKKNNESQMRKLEEKMSANVISIDISLNEIIGDIGNMVVETDSGSENISVYSFHTLLAEKFRSVLQQVERNRSRRQDIYDLNFLITNYSDNTVKEKHKVLVTLLKISENKNIDKWLNSKGLSSKDIEERSKQESKVLSFELSSEDDFDIDREYEVVKSYYEAMPWNLHEN